MALFGIGVDSVEIERVKRAARSQTFLRRVFTEEERRYAEEKGNGAPQSLAGAFAAKEAAVKALGCGFRGFGPDDVEIRHDEAGAPRLFFRNEAKAYAERRGAGKALVSISHDQTRAVAVVVLEKDSEEA